MNDPIEETLADIHERSFPLNIDSPHIEFLLDTNLRVGFYLVDFSGLKAGKIEALLPIVVAEMARRRLVPVFVTDLLDYRLFREAGVIFESVPPEFESSALMPEKDWRARREEILALVRDKWNPAGETDFRDENAINVETR